MCLTQSDRSTSTIAYNFKANQTSRGQNFHRDELLKRRKKLLINRQIRLMVRRHDVVDDDDEDEGKYTIPVIFEQTVIRRGTNKSKFEKKIDEI